MRLVPWLGIIYMRELALNNFFEKKYLRLLGNSRKLITRKRTWLSW